MSCPIKDEHGNLDEEALRDLVIVGGHLVEGGIRNYHEWAEGMKAKVGDVFNNGDLRTIWLNVKADAADRTGVPQSISKEDAFIESLSRRLGSMRAAADFANALVGPGGDTTLMGKLMDEQPLTAEESARVVKAYRDNIVDRKPVRTAEGPMAIVQKALDDAKPKKTPSGASAAPGPRGKTERQPGGPARAGSERQAPSLPGMEDLSERYRVQPDREREQGPPEEATADELFDRYMTKRLGSSAAAENFRKAVGEDVYEKLVTEAPLDDAERAVVEDAVRDHMASRGPAAERQPSAPASTAAATEAHATVDDIVGAVRKERADERAAAGNPREDLSERYEVQPDHTAEGEPGVTDDEKFDREMAHQLGGKPAAEQFRSMLGDELYTKLVTEGTSTLTPHEVDAVTEAFARSSTARKASSPSEIAKALSPIAKEARAQLAHEEEQARLATFEKAKGLVREQLADVVPESRLPAVDKALDAVKDGDTQGLAEVFNHHAPRGFLRTNRLWVQGAMLSNPGSLFGTALVSHLMSAGVENTVAKSIASRLSAGLHAGVDTKALSRAIAKSMQQGRREGWEIFKHGENKLTLEGRNGLHRPGAPLQAEFTVGNGGKGAKAFNAVGRAGGRMHGAVWHLVGVGLDEIAKQDAAHYAAIDEMEARNEKWTPEQIRTRAHELLDHPTQKVLDTARDLREEQMFQNDNWLASKVSGAQGGKNGAVGRAIGDLAAPIVPFARVASNISGRALEHTPIGAAVSAFSIVHDFADKNRLELRTAADFKAAIAKMPAAQRARIYRIVARAVIGTGVALAGYAAYKGGLVNAPVPERGEYGSVNAFGRKWEAGRVMGPFAAPMFLGADFARAQEQGKSMPSAKDVAEAFTENPFANVSEAWKNLTESASGKGKPSGFAKFAGSVAGAEVPSLMRSIAAVTDPTHMMRNRDTDSVAQYIWNSVKVATPGLRETLPVKVVKKTGKPIPEASTLLPVPRNVPAPSPAELKQLREKDAYFAKKKGG